MAGKASAMRWWLLAAMMVVGATVPSGWAEPPAEPVGRTIASLRAGAEALEKRGLPSYARKQRDLAETLQFWMAAHETLTPDHITSLEGLAKSLSSGAQMWGRTDPRKFEVLKQQAAIAEHAVAVLRPLAGAAPTADVAAGLTLLTVRVEAPANGAPGRIVLVEPARTFSAPEEITTYLKSTTQHFSDATVVFQVDDAATFATVRQVVNAVADAAMNGPMRIEGLKLRTAAPGRRLGRTPPGPLPEDLRPVRTP